MYDSAKLPNGEEALLVLVGQVVGPAVVGLLEDVLATRYVLQIHGNLQGSLPHFLTIRQPQIRPEIRVLMF